MKQINCKHYIKECTKNGVYTYEVQGQEFNLCEQCELELLADMKRQEVWENKGQRRWNAVNDKDIEHLQKQIDKLKAKK